ncbi:hypothetical protein, partial [Rhizobium sp. Root482]|uniref:hypothetical protein n=1 Tax=Rhizobium sp. Root482 TaxID=1736543 RepID=UPI001AEBAF24
MSDLPGQEGGPAVFRSRAKLQTKVCVISSDFLSLLGVEFSDWIRFATWLTLRGCLKKRWVISTGYDSFGFAKIRWSSRWSGLKS